MFGGGWSDQNVGETWNAVWEVNWHFCRGVKWPQVPVVFVLFCILDVLHGGKNEPCALAHWWCWVLLGYLVSLSWLLGMIQSVFQLEGNFISISALRGQLSRVVVTHIHKNKTHVLEIWLQFWVYTRNMWSILLRFAHVPNQQALRSTNQNQSIFFPSANVKRPFLSK